MRFRLTLVLTIGLLAACDKGSVEAPQERTQSTAPLEQSTPPVQMDQPAEPRSPKVAIAEQQGLPPRDLANGGLLPLAEILAIARRRVPGDVIEVELDDDDDDPPEYELEILTPDGRSIDMKIDARTGRILEVEED